MIACFDVHYRDNDCCAAVVLFDDWADEQGIEQFTLRCEASNEYIPGEFYRRELAPLQTLIHSLDLPIQTYVIDAYCHLSPAGSPGLGAHLHKQLKENAVVIGVAKNRFRKTEHAIEVFRGESERPLFVTSVGIDYQSAADRIKLMHGEHRNPTLLKMVDRLCRSE